VKAPEKADKPESWMTCSMVTIMGQSVVGRA
jgi:hypothetical protein